MRDIVDKVAVITGGASGLGLAMARRFGAEGMRLVIADIERDALERARQELAAAGHDTLAVPTDVGDPSQVEALAESTYARFGAVHVLCNNAGVGVGGTAWDASLEDWQWCLGVNLWGVVHGIRAFVPRMIAGGDAGHVVNTSSIAGLLCPPMLTPYTTAKHAVVALSESLQHDLVVRGSKLKVSALCPAFVQTRIAESERNRPSSLRREGGRHPPDPVAQQIMQAVAAGIEPSVVAEAVLDAIRHDRFWIFTHPEQQPALERRLHNILAGKNPVLEHPR